MSGDDGSDIIFLHDNASYNGDMIAGGTAREVSARIELDLAYSSEKVSNLELLVMQVADKASDYEILSSGSGELLTESIENAFQFDILSGFLNSELKEIESFMSNLQLDIIAAHKKFAESDDKLEESLSKNEAKLHHAEESLRNSQELVADIRKQSEKFEKLVVFGILTDEDLENDNLSLMNSKWNLQSVEQQRHFLQSLEKSLAREMDLENMLSESRYNEKELNMKLHFAEQEANCSEDLVEVMMERVFAAENTAELLLGNSKEFMRELHNGQFCSNSSTNRKWENSNMEKAILNLEEKLKESDTQLEHAKASVDANEEQKNMLYTTVKDMERLIEDLKGKVFKAENRAEIAEAKYALLTDTKSELNEELSFLRGRLESLEASVHQADKEKIATAKDISNRTRHIFELVKKLAFEREHLQLQMSVLTKRNKILTKKCLWSENDIFAKNNNDIGNINSYDEILAESLPISFQVDEPIRSDIFERKQDAAVLAEESMADVPNIEVVRTIEATQLNWKYIFMAFIVFLLSLLAVSLFST